MLCNLGDRNPKVIDAGSLQNDAKSPNHTSSSKDPQKQAIQNQSNVLPVFFNLQ